jgi:ribosomal protein S18 acetylase RimI-like enzyme
MEMNYNKADENDTLILEKIIKQEFPYTTYDSKKINSKIFDKKYFIIKAHQKNIFTGFGEIEFFENKARLNAIYVEEAWRGQKIATKILKKIIHECKRRRIHTIFLLVKENNDGAKQLYKKLGFNFEKIYEKEIDNSLIEVWNYHIN